MELIRAELFGIALVSVLVTVLSAALPTQTSSVDLLRLLEEDLKNGKLVSLQAMDELQPVLALSKELKHHAEEIFKKACKDHELKKMCQAHGMSCEMASEIMSTHHGFNFPAFPDLTVPQLPQPDKLKHVLNNVLRGGVDYKYVMINVSGAQRNHQCRFHDENGFPCTIDCDSDGFNFHCEAQHLVHLTHNFITILPSVMNDLSVPITESTSKVVEPPPTLDFIHTNFYSLGAAYKFKELMSALVATVEQLQSSL